ncbi:hypothetical protein BDY21DRAFT_333788 [Lineolata rhizophorae]|uniref:Luciferase domain-containing protein n=1 Tax=Lineolata rhizophorae TaxID=578093 RepID=A0A6A6PAJ6_9PEZI|nr:hypothetical protein BDY21DRAFT_333788 [Lineolata rhizophorae]
MATQGASPILLTEMSTVTSFAITTILLIPALSYLYVLLRRDYDDFLSLGPGGTPSTPLGYLRIKILSFFALRDPCRAAPVPPNLRPQRGYLSMSTLPVRAGPRPRVRGIAPHRQMTQRGPPNIFNALAMRLQALAAYERNGLALGTSCFEKHSTGLFCVSPVLRTCAGEVCHAHGSDGSLHLTLHPADAAAVLASGWGERHPLAKGGWLSRFVPAGFIMVYAPRDEVELEVVMQIILASAWWVGGRIPRPAGEGAVESRKPFTAVGLVPDSEGDNSADWAARPCQTTSSMVHRS